MPGPFVTASDIWPALNDATASEKALTAPSIRQYRRKRIAVGIIGQSNEQMRALPAGLGLYPQAFGSLRNPDMRGLMNGQIFVPDNGSAPNGLRRSTPHGGMWWKMYDDLYDWGYECSFFNGAIGSSSLIDHWAGAIKPWVANTLYFPKRVATAEPDSGYLGDLIIRTGSAGASLFRCTTGKASYVLYDRLIPLSGTDQKVDYFTTIGTGTSGGAEPAWSGVAVGGTITDGTLVWTCERLNDVGFTEGSVTNGFRVGRQNHRGFYFDPYYLLDRVMKGVLSIDADEHYVVIQNGQADVGNAQNDYQAALQNIGQYVVDRGAKAIIGLTCYSPTLTTIGYDKLQTARAAALTTFNGSTAVQANGSSVQPGANLYASMGTTMTGKLEADNVHLNGPGSIEAGGYWGDAFKAFLPNNY